MSQNHQRRPSNHERKAILQNFLASTNIEQTKNSIRNIIDAHTHNINFQIISQPTGNAVKPQAKEIPSEKDSHVQVLTGTIQGIREPLVKMVDQNELITRKLQKLNTQMKNLHKPENQQIDVDFLDFNNWKVWMGKVFSEIFQRSFHLYSTQKLLYNQMRAFCCEKIITNLLSFDMLNTDVLKATPCIEWENQVAKIVDHECFKYPQTSQVVINKKLEEKVNQNQISNFESDDYDLLDKMNFQFKYKHTGDYTEEIMTFLNKVVTLPEKITDKNNGLSLLNNFNIFFSNVFSLVNHRPGNKDMGILLHEMLTDYQYCQYKFTEEDEIEYREKVKSYTKYEIGSKIPLNAPLYLPDEIVSGKIEIKSKPVGRVIDKWIDELRDKILKPEVFINDRIHRFKGQEPGQRTKLTKNQKQILVSKLKDEKANFQKFHQKLKENLQWITEKLLSNLGGFSDMTYVNEKERSAGEFACKMQQAGLEYGIQKLNFLIGSLLKSVERMKDDINKTKPYSFIGEDIKLNLVTFKIGDLLRCKFTSKEDEVIRIFEFLITMSEMNYRKMFKIIRIKNRLNHSTRDILINALFKNEVVCEIQLAVNEETNKKQKYMDKFNHFLYEIKRAEVGIMLEICNIWVNNSAKAESFKRELIRERERKQKYRETIGGDVFFEIVENKHKIQKLPFICKLCKVFHPQQRTIFAGVVFEDDPDPICGECLSTRIQRSQRVKYLFDRQEHKPPQMLNYSHKLTMSEGLEQLFDLERVLKAKRMLLIPINSRKIIKYPVHVVQTPEVTFIVRNYLTNDGNIDMKIIHQFDKALPLKDQEKKFFEKFCIFVMRLPVQIKPIVLKKTNINGLIQQDFKKIQIYQAKNDNRLHCLYMPLGEESVLFPHYHDPALNEAEILKNNTNTMKIITSIKKSKDVMELSGINLSDELNTLPQGIKLKMNAIIKELYLNQNQLQNIDFVSQIHGLIILNAKRNRITKIPEMPQNIEIIELGMNFISKLQGFSNKVYEKLRILYFCANQIEKIENLQNVPNLKELSLVYNKVSVIEGLEKLTKLKRLNLSYNPIKKLENLQELKSIEYLSIGNTQINQINGLESLQSLTTLILDSSNVSMSNGGFELPKKIKNLNLSNNKISSLVPLEEMDQMQQLILHDNMIGSFEVSQWLGSIKLLNLSRNKIEQIPEMKMLTDLKELYLSHNQIKQVKGLEENMFLSVLDISHNKIRELRNIKYLVNLTKLTARNNEIEYMEEFENLKSLSELELGNNLIQTIIGLPQSVKKIGLENNKIKEVDWISVLIKKKSEEDKVEEINLKNNQIPQVMMILVKQMLGMGLGKILV